MANMSITYDDCPHICKMLTDEELATLSKYYRPCSLSTTEKIESEFIRVGTTGCFLFNTFTRDARKIRDMKILPTDVFVNSFPRSGATWTQELVWLILNDMDIEKAKSVGLRDRYCMALFEYYMIFSDLKDKLEELFREDETKLEIIKKLSMPPTELLAKSPSPRFIPTNLPIELLPKDLGTAKVVYVARDPRDVAVSTYFFFRCLNVNQFTADFKTYYYKIFTKDCVLWSPYFSHVKNAWQMKNDFNFLFLFYEELSKDLRGTAKRVAKFFGKNYTEVQYDHLSGHLEFTNFQKNKAVDIQFLRDLKLYTTETSNNYIRKGKVGGWRDHFDEEMTKHAEQWIEENLRDTDLRFPQ